MNFFKKIFGKGKKQATETPVADDSVQSEAETAPDVCTECAAPQPVTKLESCATCAECAAPQPEVDTCAECAAPEPAVTEPETCAACDECAAPESEVAATCTESPDADDSNAESSTTYNRSFEAKIIQSEDSLKEKYSVLKNELLSYRNVHSRLSWTNDTFNFGRDPIAKFAIRGKTLSLYLAPEAATADQSKYRYENVTNVKRYERTPVMLRLKSDRAVKYAAELITLVAESKSLVRLERESEDFAPKFEADEELLARGLIKLTDAPVGFFGGAK